MLRHNSNELHQSPLSIHFSTQYDEGKSRTGRRRSRHHIVNECRLSTVLLFLKQQLLLKSVNPCVFLAFVIVLSNPFVQIEALQQQSIFRATGKSSPLSVSTSGLPICGESLTGRHQLSTSKYLLSTENGPFATGPPLATMSLAGCMTRTPSMFISQISNKKLKVSTCPQETFIISSGISVCDPNRDRHRPGSSSLLIAQNQQRQRGVLGFQIGSGEASSEEGGNGHDQFRLRKKSSFGFGLNVNVRYGPSNVDFGSWNWPEPLSLDSDNNVGTAESVLFDRNAKLDGLLWPLDGSESRSTSNWDIDSGAVSDVKATSSQIMDDTKIGLPYIPSVQQIQSLKIIQLKEELGIRSLRKSGNKAALQERFIAWIEEQRTSGDIERGNIDGSPFTADPTQVAKDLEPLLQRRAIIHKEKTEGKRVYRSEAVPKFTASSPLPENYRESLRKAYERPSSLYSNLDVKLLYAASKHADQTGNKILSKQLLLELKNNATPQDPRLFRRLARMEQEDGNIEKAIEILHEGLVLNPNNAYLLHGLGQIYNKARDLDRARDYFQKAIEADPTLPNSHHALGTMEHTLGRVAIAMKILKKGIEYCPSNHRLHHAIGDVYREAKLLEMASKSYRKALSTGPTVSHGFAYTALAYVAYEQDDISQCRSWLRKAAKDNDGRNSNAWVAWAQLEESEGNIDGARTVCLTAIAQYERGLLEKLASGQPNSQFRSENFELTPHLIDKVSLRSKLRNVSLRNRSGDRFFNIYRTWARLEERFGSLDSTNDAFERASTLFPQNWKITLDWANFCAKQGAQDRARSLFTDACRKASNHNRHADPFRLYAEFEFLYGDYEKAREILSNGLISLTSTSRGKADDSPRIDGLPELLYTWAVCEWRLSSHSRAKILFQRILKTVSPDDANMRALVLLAMAKLEVDLGEYHRAQHYISLCLKESNKGTFGAQVWRCWANVATLMGDTRLAQQCEKYSAKAEKEGEENLKTGTADLVALNLMADSSPRTDSQQLLRRDPWQSKIFGTPEQQHLASSFFRNCVQLPVEKTIDQMLIPHREALIK